MKFFRIIVSLLLLAIASAICSCGASPTPPENGIAGSVLIQDSAGFNNNPPALIWIGFDSPQKLAQLQPLLGTSQRVFVMGRVVPCEQCTWGFELDPSTTSLPGIIIPETLQPVRNVSQNLTAWSGQDVAITGTVIKIQKSPR